MNIIIVAKPHATPITLNLATWRVRAALGCVVIGCLLLFVGLGSTATMLLTNPRVHALHELHALRAQITTQQQSVDTLETSSRRDMDALAVQLGRLQARALRLDALGQRLTQIGKLDDSEFDFGAAPAMGGPEDPTAVPQALNASLSSNIASLRGEFQRDETRLSVLEQLLLDRRVENALLPSGYPVATGYIGSGFGTRTDPINGGVEHHLGIDFDAPIGTPIHAVADGVVTFVGQRTGYGNVVEIDHGGGYMTRYAHDRDHVVSVGQRVHAGQVIAHVGMTGRTTGPHCHFEVWLHGRAVNPLSYVKRSVKNT